MFTFALTIGIYSYLIFFLGLVGLLYRDVIILVTVSFWGVVLLLQIKIIKTVMLTLFLNKSQKKFGITGILFLLFILLAVVNLIGTLGPELAFDALWYHLTFPKLYLQNHTIDFIPGGLLYYSAMPKLGEMLYVGGLAFGNEITVKLIHFLFGLLTSLALYKLARKFFTPFISLLAVVIFYANLVVAWESITAYVDLVRAFFEVMALWAFINWWLEGKRKWFIWSAVMVGLAITTKLLGIGSLIIFSFLIVLDFFRKKSPQPPLIKGETLRFPPLRKGGVRQEGGFVLAKTLFIRLLVYWIIALLTPLPWFLFAYFHTGNPVYPFFTHLYPVSPSQLSLIDFFREVWILFTQAADPISPTYLLCLPLLILFWGKMKQVKGIGIIGAYSLLAIIIWYFTPRTGGGRFILPYLPAFSLLCTAIYFAISKQNKFAYMRNFLLVGIIFVSLTTIAYRFIANAKYIPAITGQESKQQFLTDHLNFSFGDFYDTDNYFKEHIKENDRVLLYGFHNLYYIDFPFIDASWRKKEDTFTYVATQNTELPREFTNWQLVYKNDKTMVKLYKKSPQPPLIKGVSGRTGDLNLR